MGELAHYARLKPLLDRNVVRTILFARDQYRCAYCDIQVTYRSGTVDHYLPKSWFKKAELGLAAASTWNNMVVACEPCNTSKANHLPKVCGMHPKVYPYSPNVVRIDYPGLAIRKIQNQLVAEYITHNLETGEWTTSKVPPPT